MPLALVNSRTLLGAQAPAVTVEVHVGNGLPAFHIVGLPAAAVREARDRVRAALLHSGFDFPNRRLTVNLAPADLPKDSGRFDLPIAIGILVATGQVPGDRLGEHELVGELSLTGGLRPAPGLLPIALGLRSEAPERILLAPAHGAEQAAIVIDIRVKLAEHLTEVCAYFRGAAELPSPATVDFSERASRSTADFSELLGQAAARRAAEIAAAGRHHLLLIGPPGSGKSMLAERLPGILPPLSHDEAMEAGAIATLRAQFDPKQMYQRRCRSPHHSASAAALIGGGNPPRPGEASLAHHGVLFLDELPEFNRAALDALREPLETGHVELARAGHAIRLPADFQLLAAMNPCPCGQFGQPECRCSPEQVARYQRRISGPILDRIDLQLRLDPVDREVLLSARPAETSAAIAARVAKAWVVQQMRQGLPNARLAPAQLEQHAALSADCQRLLRAASQRLGLSARGMHRAQRVARTIADLAGAAQIEPGHVAESIGYRRGLFKTADSAGLHEVS